MNKRLSYEAVAARAAIKGLTVSELDQELGRATLNCPSGHVWTARNDMVGKRGCPRCATRRKPLGIEKVKLVAEERGGLCLAERYVSKADPMAFVCAQGHEWESTANSVVWMRTWCPVCAKARKAARTIAQSTGRATSP